MRDPGSQPTESGSNICALNHMLHCFPRRMFLSSLLSCFCEVFRESRILATQPLTGCRLLPSSFSGASSWMTGNLDLCASLYHLHRLGHHKCNLQTQVSFWRSGGANSWHPASVVFYGTILGESHLVYCSHLSMYLIPELSCKFLEDRDTSSLRHSESPGMTPATCSRKEKLSS